MRRSPVLDQHTQRAADVWAGHGRAGQVVVGGIRVIDRGIQPHPVAADVRLDASVVGRPPTGKAAHGDAARAAVAADHVLHGTHHQDVLGHAFRAETVVVAVRVARRRAPLPVAGAGIVVIVPAAGTGPVVIPVVAGRFADQVVRVIDGKVVQFGAVAGVKAEPVVFHRAHRHVAVPEPLAVARVVGPARGKPVRVIRHPQTPCRRVAHLRGITVPVPAPQRRGGRHALGRRDDARRDHRARHVRAVVVRGARRIHLGGPATEFLVRGADTAAIPHAQNHARAGQTQAARTTRQHRIRADAVRGHGVVRDVVLGHPVDDGPDLDHPGGRFLPDDPPLLPCDLPGLRLAEDRHLGIRPVGPDNRQPGDQDDHSCRNPSTRHIRPTNNAETVSYAVHPDPIPSEMRPGDPGSGTHFGAFRGRMPRRYPTSLIIQENGPRLPPRRPVGQPKPPRIPLPLRIVQQG